MPIHNHKREAKQQAIQRDVSQLTLDTPTKCATKVLTTMDYSKAESEDDWQTSSFMIREAPTKKKETPATDVWDQLPYKSKKYVWERNTTYAHSPQSSAHLT